MNAELPFVIHNCATEPSTNSFPFRPQRLPESLVPALGATASNVMRMVHTEIRFRLEPGHTVKLVLSCPERHAVVSIFWGDYQGSRIYVLGAEPQEIQVKAMPQWIEAMEKRVDLPRHRFAPELVRVCLFGYGSIIHEIQGKGMSRPEPGDVPSKRLLCCGSSLTFGAYASVMQSTYPSQLAYRMGWDLINLGLSGGFQAEKAHADYVAERKDWDMATVELSANMAGKDDDYFFSRAKYFTWRLATSQPTRPVIAISIFRSFRDLPVLAGEAHHAMAVRKRALLKQAVEENNLPNLHFIDGPKLLPSFHGLAADILHMGDEGFAELARHLHDYIRSL